MSRYALLSIGLALFGTAALPAPVLAADAPATPAPASAEATHPDIVFNRVFIFFRRNDTALTPLMAKQVARAAELARQGGASRIKITGYSDDAKQPEQFGLQRAEAIKAELVKQGVAEAMIQTQARVKAPASNVGGPNPANHRARIALIRAYAAPVGPHDTAR